MPKFEVIICWSEEDKAFMGAKGSCSAEYQAYSQAQARAHAALAKMKDGRAMDQGRQASGEDDTVELPPLSVERGAAVAESARIADVNSSIDRIMCVLLSRKDF